MTGRSIREWFDRTYDRLLALGILVALLLSLVMLAMQAQTLKRDQEQFDRALQQLAPNHPTAKVEGREMFDGALVMLNDPIQTAVWSSKLLIPEQRVRCVNCERPIPSAAKVCSFCQKEQPDATRTDSDGDGMPDEWEKKYGLNPIDPEDAKSDLDHDGFTNKEEFDFGASPKDANDHPPALAKVVVDKIQPIKFQLIFKGTSRLSGKTVFQINLWSGQRTWWAGLGEEVQGFKVVDYVPNGPDGPVLTLQRGEKLIPLIKGKEVPRNEYEVTLRYTPENKPIPTRVEAEFELKGVKYRVIKVDMGASRVLIHDPSRNTDVWIDRQVAEPKAEQPQEVAP